jgi:Clostripain family
MSTTDPQNNGKVNEEQQPPYEWTILLYMAGDNNLSEECVYALTEIKSGLKVDQPRLKVVAQFDPAGTRAETKRYELQPRDISTLDDDAKKTGWKMRETDTGEPGNLLNFLIWGIPTFKAKHYMVVLVGHGTGTDDDFLSDDNPGNSLSIPELQNVFATVKENNYTIDILGMDTCLMSMAEVCYEMLHKNVKYMVGSEGFAPNTGWPYAEIISALSKKIPTDDYKADPDPARSVAQMIVDKYREFYEPYINGGISVDQSVLEVAKIVEVEKALSGLVEVLVEDLKQNKLDHRSAKQDALLMAHWEAQSYNGETFVDLYDFCQLLEERYKDVSVDKRCQEVREAIRNLVVRYVVSGAAFQYSYGLSIYFPWAALAQKYGRLSFPQATNWTEFLQRYHSKTRRKGRSGKAAVEDVNDQAVPVDPSDLPPVRSTVPTNKGRNGNVHSMRNPPSKELIFTWPDDEAKVADERTGTSETTASKEQVGSQAEAAATAY